MDAPTVIAILGVVTPVFTVVLGYAWKVHQDRVKALERLESEKALADLKREISAEVAEVQRKQTAFELQAFKDFITQPALMQVMSSLDRTLTAMGDLMKENQRETRAGLDALNKRIDTIFNDHRTAP